MIVINDINKMIISIKDLNELVVKDSDYPIIINFTATWCGPCSLKSLKNLLEELSEKGVKIFKVDIDQFDEYASSLGINSIPRFHIYKKKGIPEVLNGTSEDTLRKLSEITN